MSKKLFEQAVVGGINLKNRLVRSATWEGMANQGKVSEALINMYTDLAKGGVGLIITGYVGFSEMDHHSPTTVQITDDEAISELKKLADAVHEHGAKLMPEINHSSTQTFSMPDGPVYGPSDVVDPSNGIKSTPISKEQLKKLSAEFADAALRAKKAGCDGVQIHGAHGFLISKFLSPKYNKRTDEYGGDPLNRARLALEILAETKSKCGDDFPVWIKLNCTDFEADDKGLLFDDFLIIAKELAKNKIDAIEVSGGTITGIYAPLRSKEHESYHLDYAKQLTDETNVPIILVGGNRKLESIENILLDTKIEAISMSRPLIREPNLVKRWAQGDTKEATCLACNCCMNPEGTTCFHYLTGEAKKRQQEVLKNMANLYDI